MQACTGCGVGRGGDGGVDPCSHPAGISRVTKHYTSHPLNYIGLICTSRCMFGREAAVVRAAIVRALRRRRVWLRRFVLPLACRLGLQLTALALP